MDTKFAAHYYDDVEPVEKLEELTELLKEYNPQIHTCKDEGYNYLEEDDVCITLKNQFGKEFYIDLNDEFTISYDVWHCHYSPYQGEYEMLKEELKLLLTNTGYIFSVFIQDQWMGSMTLEEPLTSKTQVKKQIQQFLKRDKQWIRQAKAKGVEARMVYWDESNNMIVTFVPTEY